MVVTKLKNNKKTGGRDSFIKIIPLSLILIIIPMIVFMKSITVEGIAAQFYPSTSVKDFFNYYKVVWLIIFTVISVSFVAYYAYIKKIQFKLNFCIIPLLVYYLFVFLSTSFSKHHDIAFNGFIDRFEGFWVITCYVIVCIVAAHFVTYEKDVKLLFGALGICAFILCILGFSQFFGFDFLQTDFMKHAMLPSKDENLVKSLSFNFPTKYVYLTLFNPNYVGSFCAMVFPLFVVLVLLSKNKYTKLISGILSFFLLVNLICSRSSTGYISVFVTGIFLIVLLRKRIIMYWIPVLSLTICISGVLIYINYNNAGIISNEFFSFLPKKQTPIAYVDGKPKAITDMKIDNNNLYIHMGDTPVKVVFDPNEGTLIFFDDLGNELPIIKSTTDSSLISFDSPKYIGLCFNINQSVLTVSAPNTIYYVTLDSSGSFKFLNSGNKPVDIETAASFGFKGYETWASNRGYIWSRSIPLMKDTLFLGHGPDTYAIYFPQNDFKGKLQSLKLPNTLVDKPHNMYLQIAINTGVVSLIAFLVFILWYIVRSFKLYFKPKEDNIYYMAGVACVLSVIGFLVAGLANDSNINVSPIFWILLGTGLACNRLYTNSITAEPVQQQASRHKKK